MFFPKGQPPGKFPKNDFNIPWQRHQIWSKGWRVTWEQCELCPCAESEDSDAGQIGCPSCGGRGRIWFDPQEIRAQITQVSRAEDWKPIGPWDTGEIRITLQPEHLAAKYDRFTALEAVFIIREIATRTDEGPTRLRYPIVTRTIDLDTGVINIAVTRARRQEASGAGAVAPMVEGIDFDIVDGLVDWTKGDLLGTAPAVGRRFAMRYHAHPSFEAITDGYCVRDTRLEFKEVDPAYAPMIVLLAGKLRHSTMLA